MSASQSEHGKPRSKIALWVRFHALELILLVVALGLVGVWLLETVTYRESRLTQSVDMSPFGGTGLRIQIMYPTRLSDRNSTNDMPRIVVFPTGQITGTIAPVQILFDANSSAVNFVDSEGRIAEGRLDLLTSGNHVSPGEVFLQVADVLPTGTMPEAKIETSVSFHGQIPVTVPSLTLSIDIESPVRRLLREFAQSAGGQFATLIALALTIATIAWRRFVIRQRIRPYQESIQVLSARGEWEKVAEECEKILGIDPFFDHVGEQFVRARREVEKQSQQLESWYNDAKQAMSQKNWSQASELLGRISSIRPDYRKATELQDQARTRIQLEELWSKGLQADLGGDLDKAIRCYSTILKQDANFENVRELLARAQSLRASAGTGQISLTEARQLLALKSFLADYLGSDRSAQRRVLESVPSDVSLPALRSLGIDVVAALKDSLRDGSASQRINAIRTLGQLRDPSARPMLQQFAADPDPEVRRAVAQALAYLSPVDELVRQLADNERWQYAQKGLIAHGTKAIPQLATALAGDWPVSWRAARTLVCIGDEARDHLIVMQGTTAMPAGKIVEELLAHWEEIAEERSSGQNNRVEAWTGNTPSEGEA